MVPQFAFSPFPLFLLTQHHSLFWCNKNGRKKNSRSHFINCCCVPKHISSLKHLDISVIEHFSSLLVKYASQSCLCVHLCARNTDTRRVCVFAPVHLPDTFKCVCDVQSSKLKHHGDWAINGSINWYTVLVMSSVSRCMSLFYGLHL